MTNYNYKTPFLEAVFLCEETIFEETIPFCKTASLLLTPLKRNERTMKSTARLALSNGMKEPSDNGKRLFEVQYRGVSLTEDFCDKYIAPLPIGLEIDDVLEVEQDHIGTMVAYIHLSTKRKYREVVSAMRNLEQAKLPNGQRFHLAGSHDDDDAHIRWFWKSDPTYKKRKNGKLGAIVNKWTKKSKKSDPNEDLDLTLLQQTYLDDDNEDERHGSSSKDPSAHIQAQTKMKRKAQSAQSEQPRKQPRINQVLRSQFLLDSCH